MVRWGCWTAGLAVVEHALLCTCVVALQAKTHEYADCFLDPAALPIDKIKVLAAKGAPLLLALLAGR
jgi:hypothetical protein